MRLLLASRIESGLSGAAILDPVSWLMSMMTNPSVPQLTPGGKRTNPEVIKLPSRRRL
jgi:hypothetical protein